MISGSKQARIAPNRMKMVVKQERTCEWEWRSTIGESLFLDCSSKRGKGQNRTRNAGWASLSIRSNELHNLVLLSFQFIHSCQIFELPARSRGNINGEMVILQLKPELNRLFGAKKHLESSVGRLKGMKLIIALTINHFAAHRRYLLFVPFFSHSKIKRESFQVETMLLFYAILGAYVSPSHFPPSPCSIKSDFLFCFRLVCAMHQPAKNVERTSHNKPFSFYYYLDGFRRDWKKSQSKMSFFVLFIEAVEWNRTHVDMRRTARTHSRRLQQ